MKVFAPAQKKAFLEEREIYELSRLASPSVTSSLLKYFGSVEVANINETIYVSQNICLFFSLRGHSKNTWHTEGGGVNIMSHFFAS